MFQLIYIDFKNIFVWWKFHLRVVGHSFLIELLPIKISQTQIVWMYEFLVRDIFPTFASPVWCSRPLAKQRAIINFNPGP
jgi:hypothetical protein